MRALTFLGSSRIRDINGCSRIDVRILICDWNWNALRNVTRVMEHICQCSVGILKCTESHVVRRCNPIRNDLMELVPRQKSSCARYHTVCLRCDVLNPNRCEAEHVPNRVAWTERTLLHVRERVAFSNPSTILHLPSGEYVGLPVTVVPAMLELKHSLDWHVLTDVSRVRSDT